MRKAMVPAIIVLILALALVVPWKFGFVTIDQFIYLGQMTGGWLAWTALVAILYAGVEKLFPDLLCPPPVVDPAPRADGP